MIKGGSRDAELDYDGVESRILRLKDGFEVGRQRDLPVILAANRGVLLTAGSEPDLWVALHRYSLKVGSK
jgi:hypothetical protein